jgi:hypothetical protein
LSSAAPILFNHLVGEQQFVLDATAAFEDIRVGWRAEPFTADFGGAELEFLGDVGATGPLDAVFVVVGPDVFAPHHVYLVISATAATDAFQLGGGNVRKKTLPPCMEKYHMVFGLPVELLIRDDGLSFCLFEA